MDYEIRFDRGNAVNNRYLVRREATNRAQFCRATRVELQRETQRETVLALGTEEIDLSSSSSFNSRQSFRSCIITCLCGEASGQEEDAINGGTIV